MAANWKLITENFQEYYHLAWVHPELARVSRVRDHYRYQGPGLYCGQTTTPVSADERDAGDDFFAAERDRLFGRAWVAVASAADVAEPGRLLVRIVGGTSLITRDRDGVLRGFINSCRHRGTRPGSTAPTPSAAGSWPCSPTFCSRCCPDTPS